MYAIVVRDWESFLNPVILSPLEGCESRICELLQNKWKVMLMQHIMIRLSRILEASGLLEKGRVHEPEAAPSRADLLLHPHNMAEGEAGVPRVPAREYFDPPRHVIDPLDADEGQGAKSIIRTVLRIALRIAFAGSMGDYGYCGSAAACGIGMFVKNFRGRTLLHINRDPRGNYAFLEVEVF